MCYRADFAGRENVPRLADQREDYLLKSLREYKSGARRGYDTSMAEVLQPVDDMQLIELGLLSRGDTGPDEVRFGQHRRLRRRKFEGDSQSR